MAKCQYTDSGRSPHPSLLTMSADIPLPGAAVLSDGSPGPSVFAAHGIARAFMPKATSSIIIASFN